MKSNLYSFKQSYYLVETGLLFKKWKLLGAGVINIPTQAGIIDIL